MGEESYGVVVEAVCFVAVEITLGCIWARVKWWLTREGVGVEMRVNQMRAPGRGVAGHEKEGEEFIAAVAAAGDGCRVNTLVLSAEVGEDVERRGLVKEREVSREQDIDSQDGEEVWLVTQVWSRSC